MTGRQKQARRGGSLLKQSRQKLLTRPIYQHKIKVKGIRTDLRYWFNRCFLFAEFSTPSIQKALNLGERRGNTIDKAHPNYAISSCHRVNPSNVNNFIRLCFDAILV